MVPSLSASDDSSLSARDLLAADLHALARRCALGELAAGEVQATRAAVAAVMHQLGERGERGWWEQSGAGAERWRALAPFRGSANPIAPGLVIDPGGIRFEHRSDPDGHPTDVEDKSQHGKTQDAAIARLDAQITVGRLFAGPPGCVHGGVIAGLFDELFGALAQAMAGSGMIATATLSVRYHLPTPIDTALRFSARVSRSTPSRMKAQAECVADGNVTAKATALLVRRSRPVASSQ